MHCDVYITGLHCNDEDNLAMVTQAVNGDCTAVIAKWNSSVKGEYKQEAQIWKITYKNGDICDRTNQPRQLDLTFVCEPGTEYAADSVIEVQSCVYQLTIHTMYACPDNNKTCLDDDGGDNYGLSAGWIFIIVLLIGIV